MTDEQIVKALECCGNMNECKKECPLDDLGGIDKCIHTLMLNALDLIKRQQAEIEKLNKVKVFNFTVSGTEEIIPILFNHEKEMKNEAVKEFAERLKDKSEHFDLEKENFVSETNIDNLVKEMTKGKK